MNQNNTSK